jgi:hypothetical protein
VTRARAALGGAQPGGSYRYRADAAAQTECRHHFRARCRAEGIAKTRVARNVSRTAALSAERAYGRRVLPIGVLHNLARGLHGDLAALARAGAIVAGLAFTATGFLKIRWTRPAGPPQEVGSTLRNFSTDAVAEPELPLVIDVNPPLGAIDARKTARHHRAGAAGSRHHAEWLRGNHPAIGQPPGQHAASGSAGRRVR